jgi:hypothetical protein
MISAKSRAKPVSMIEFENTFVNGGTVSTEPLCDVVIMNMFTYSFFRTNQMLKHRIRYVYIFRRM